jgi:hypothetical protein
MLFLFNLKHYGFIFPGVAGVAGAVPFGVITVPFGVGPGTIIVLPFGLAGVAGVAGIVPLGVTVVPFGVTVVPFGVTTVPLGVIVVPGCELVPGPTTFPLGVTIVPLGRTLLPGVTVPAGGVIPLGVVVLPGAGLICAEALFIANAKTNAVLIIAIFFINICLIIHRLTKHIPKEIYYPKWNFNKPL